MVTKVPVIQRVSFYPFSYQPTSKEGYYSVIRYNIFRHKWVVLERMFGEEEVARYVQGLNEEAGLITEKFIVGYK